MIFYTAQVFAILSFLALLISYWQTKRSKILFYQILDSLFDVVQYFLLGGYTGSFTNLIGALRAYIFGKEYHSNFMLYVFLCLYMLIGIVTYNGLFSLLPTIAALFYTVVVWKGNPKQIRIAAIIVSILWIIYSYSVMAYMAMVTEGILLCSNMFAIIYLDKKQSKNNQRDEEYE